jgi:Domain of unknown function (DUF4265)
VDEQPLTKVHVDLPNHWAVGGESMWARELGADRYRIENVPFYAYGLNFSDVVEARAQAPDQKPSVLRVVERSGHNTLRVMFDAAVSEARMLELLAALEPLAVSFERSGEHYFALDLEPEASVEAVRDQLDRWEAEGLLGYETCEARVPGSFDSAPDA